MGKAKKETKTKKSSKTTTKKTKETKKRGRPPGSKNKPKDIAEISNENNILASDSLSNFGSSLKTEDYDQMLIKELKSKQKPKEPEEVSQEYEPEEEEEEDDLDGYDVEGYDIETEAFEGDDLIESLPKKGRRRKKKALYEEIGIDEDYYESDYNIGDFQDYD